MYIINNSQSGDIIYGIDTDADTISTISNTKKAGGSRSGSGKKKLSQADFIENFIQKASEIYDIDVEVIILGEDDESEEEDDEDDDDDGDHLVTSTVPDLPPVPDHDLVVDNLSNRFAKLNA